VWRARENLELSEFDCRVTRYPERTRGIYSLANYRASASLTQSPRLYALIASINHACIAGFPATTLV
jgi:hypothetical protein